MLKRLLLLAFIACATSTVQDSGPLEDFLKQLGSSWQKTTCQNASQSQASTPSEAFEKCLQDTNQLTAEVISEYRPIALQVLEDAASNVNHTYYQIDPETKRWTLGNQQVPATVDGDKENVKTLTAALEFEFQDLVYAKMEQPDNERLVGGLDKRGHLNAIAQSWDDIVRSVGKTAKGADNAVRSVGTTAKKIKQAVRKGFGEAIELAKNDLDYINKAPNPAERQLRIAERNEARAVRLAKLDEEILLGRAMLKEARLTRKKARVSRLRPDLREVREHALSDLDYINKAPSPAERQLRIAERTEARAARIAKLKEEIPLRRAERFELVDKRIAEVDEEFHIRKAEQKQIRKEGKAAFRQWYQDLKSDRDYINKAPNPAERKLRIAERNEAKAARRAKYTEKLRELRAARDQGRVAREQARAALGGETYKRLRVNKYSIDQLLLFRAITKSVILGFALFGLASAITSILQHYQVGRKRA